MAVEVRLSNPSSVPVPRPLHPLLMVVTLGGCPLLCLVLTVPPTPGLGFSPEAAPRTFAWWILAHPPAVSLPGHLPQPETQLGCTRMHSDAHTHTQAHTPHRAGSLYGLLSSLHIPPLTFTICLPRPWVVTTGLHFVVWTVRSAASPGAFSVLCGESCGHHASLGGSRSTSCLSRHCRATWQTLP